jgi:hypothetical protein
VTEETNSEKEKPQGNVDPAKTGESIPPVQPPQQAPIPPLPPSTESQVSGNVGAEKSETNLKKCEEISVRIVKEGNLTPFEEKTLYWTRVAFFLVLATLVVGVLTLIVLSCQLDVMQKGLTDAESDSGTSRRHARQQLRALQSQVEAIQTQMRQDQRPYISVSLGGPGPGKPFEVKMTANNILHLPLRMMVSGKTPARHVHGRLFVEIVSVNQDPLLDGNTAPALDTLAGVVFPNEPQELNAIRMKAKKGNKLGEFDLLKESEHRAIFSYQSYLAAYGIYTYDDAFDIHHWTKFCVSWHAESPIVYPTPACVKYNEVDNNQ